MVLVQVAAVAPATKWITTPALKEGNEEATAASAERLRVAGTADRTD